MIRGTTPTHIFDTDISLVAAEEIYVTYVQGKTKVEKTKADIEVTEESITVEMTQEETLMFAADNYKAAVQIRALFPDGTAVASNIINIRVSPILKDGVI